MSKTKDSKHNASFLASKFLMSKRSTKPIYKLTPTSISILRYVCDSIDIYYKKHKKFHTKLNQSQIAKYVWARRETICLHLTHLVKKRLLKYDPKTRVYSLGKIFTTCEINSHPIEVLDKLTGLRSVRISNTSNSSNITNKDSPQKPSPKEWAPGNPDYDRFHSYKKRR